MSKVLYIGANPKPVDQSISLTVGEEFIKAYQDLNRDDVIEKINLFDLDIPYIDKDVFNAWGKMANGADFLELTKDEQQKITSMGDNLEQFMNADKYIFASPFWNFGVPAILKAYIDNLEISGKTFKYTADGPVGLLENKKAIFIQASGGVYSNKENNPYEHGYSYMKIALGFMGITDLTPILIEGIGMGPEQAKEAKDKALNQVKEVVKTF